MAHSADVKNAVRHSYVVELLALSVAAVKHNIANGTARRWKFEAKEQGDDWDLARTASRRAAGSVGEFTNDFIEEFTIQVNETFNLLKSEEGAGLPLPERTKILNSLTDMMSKVMKVSGGSKRVDKLTTAAEVLKLLAKYISTNHPDLTGDFVEVLTAFGPYLDKELSD
ncbi:MAG: DUF1804 family protein [Pseudomonadota bacterium]|nr:DUF1804 family protein [Pseudomonadota bacterium]